MPLKHNIEQRHGVSYATFKIFPYTMQHFLEVTDERQHRERGFGDHPIIPCAALTDSEVFRMPIALPKDSIGADHCLFRDVSYDLLQCRASVDISGVAIPVHNQAWAVSRKSRADLIIYLNSSLIYLLLRIVIASETL